MYVQIHVSRHNKRKSVYARIRENNLFQSISGSKATDWNFKMSNKCTNLCNNIVEEKAGVEMQNSKKG